MEPRSWTQPLPRPLAPPDAFLHRRLGVADAWLSESGEWRLISEEPSASLWSVLGYLRWYAPVLMAQDHQQSRTTSPDEYLRSRPLVAAIDAELARRGETAVGQALVLLGAIGLAPWELPESRRRQAGRSP
jgi:hypothetical protein